MNSAGVKWKYDYLKNPPYNIKRGGCCGGQEFAVINYQEIRKKLAKEGNIVPILQALYTTEIEIEYEEGNTKISVKKKI